MDFTWARVLFTLWVFISFILMLYVVYNRRNKEGYQNVAQSILDDEDTPESASEISRENGVK